MAVGAAVSPPILARTRSIALSRPMNESPPATKATMISHSGC